MLLQHPVHEQHIHLDYDVRTAQKYNNHTKAMMCVARVNPLSQKSTTDWLLQWNKIYWQDQDKPHVCTADAITSNSFQVMSISCCLGI